MLPNQLLVVSVLGVVFFWLTALSFFLYRTVRHYQKLTSGVNKGDLGSVLGKVLNDLGVEKKRIDEVIKRAEKVEKDNLSHIQKIGLVRFNPFAETGGNQSFVLAVLDGQDSGLIISSLHSRETTRIYAKPVKKGKTHEHQLSKEEAEAINQARRQ